MKRRYLIQEMERALISKGYMIDRFAMNDNREVRKVEGRVPYTKTTRVNGAKKQEKRYRFIRWDATGKAFHASNNKREPAYDLVLPRNQDYDKV